jgi:hypothetical protein
VTGRLLTRSLLTRARLLSPLPLVRLTLARLTLVRLTLARLTLVRLTLARLTLIRLSRVRLLPRLRGGAGRVLLRGWAGAERLLTRLSLTRLTLALGLGLLVSLSLPPLLLLGVGACGGATVTHLSTSGSLRRTRRRLIRRSW